MEVLAPLEIVIPIVQSRSLSRFFLELFSVKSEREKSIFLFAMLLSNMSLILHVHRINIQRLSLVFSFSQFLAPYFHHNVVVDFSLGRRRRSFITFFSSSFLAYLCIKNDTTMHLLAAEKESSISLSLSLFCPAPCCYLSPLLLSICARFALKRTRVVDSSPIYLVVVLFWVKMKNESLHFSLIG